MFALNEKVVYPGHGVARICRIIEKKVGGTTTNFFELAFFNKDMTILIPIDSVTSTGIRKLSSVENISTMFEILSEPCVKPLQDSPATNWNKRNKEYQCKIRTGNLQEICKIYRDLKHIATYKELSFGEKNLLDQTEVLLVEEISIVTHVSEEIAIERLRALFKRTGEALSIANHKMQRPSVASL